MIPGKKAPDKSPLDGNEKRLRLILSIMQLPIERLSLVWKFVRVLDVYMQF